MPPKRRSFGDDENERRKEAYFGEGVFSSVVRARLEAVKVPSLDDDVSVVVSLTLAVVEEETKTRERESQSRVSNHSFEEEEPNEKNKNAQNEEERKMFLSTQDEKIGNLEDPIAFTEEDFLRPKFAHRSHHHRGHGGGGQTHHERTQSSLNNATTCSILSLEDSALDATLGAEEAEALAARGRMYERNTDLMGEEEEVDPRVETALEDLNDAAEEVNKAEQEYDRGKRTLREEKERAREAVDGMYKQLGGAVKKAVPALHKRAVASLYQNRSQEAMIAHAECFDHHEKCKKTVSKLERMLAKTREETREEDDDASPSSSSSLSSSSSFSKDEDEEEDNEEETEERIDEDHGDDNHNPELATTSPSASPKKKKKRKKKKRMDKSNLRLLEKLSEAVASVTEAERVMRRALLAHETNAKLAMEAVDECARLSSNTKNIRAIKKAQRYFAIKKEGEDAIEKLESSVKEMRAKLKTCKSRYGECLEQLNAISKEIHERRELEKKTKALKLMKSSAK